MCKFTGDIAIVSSPNIFARMQHGNQLIDSFLLQTLTKKSHNLISESSEIYKQDFFGTHENEDIWFALN